MEKPFDMRHHPYQGYYGQRSLCRQLLELVGSHVPFYFDGLQLHLGEIPPQLPQSVLPVLLQFPLPAAQDTQSVNDESDETEVGQDEVDEEWHIDSGPPPLEPIGPITADNVHDLYGYQMPSPPTPPMIVIVIDDSDNDTDTDTDTVPSPYNYETANTISAVAQPSSPESPSFDPSP